MYHWRILDGKATGSSHISKSIECQDAYCIDVLEFPDEAVLVAAVSDGAGSAKFSSIGAEIIATSFVDFVRDSLSDSKGLESIDREFGVQWILICQTRLEKEASRLNQHVSQLAGTFLGVIIGGERAVFFQVGDGAIVYRPDGEEQDYVLGITPMRQEYANATHFVSDESAEQQLLFERKDEKILDITLFSDGLQSVALNLKDDVPHPPFLDKMFTPMRGQEFLYEDLNDQLLAFLNSDVLNRRTDDDRTILLASRIEGVCEPFHKDESEIRIINKSHDESGQGLETDAHDKLDPESVSVSISEKKVSTQNETEIDTGIKSEDGPVSEESIQASVVENDASASD